MIKQALTHKSYSVGNDAEKRRTTLGAIAINSESIKSISDAVIAGLSAEDAERTKMGIDAVKSAMGQAEEQQALRERLAEYSFKNPHLTHIEDE
jgi:hypothetical protein